MATALVVGAGGSSPAASGQDEHSEFVGPSPAAMQQPHIQAQMDQSLAEAERKGAQRRMPAEVEARSRSRTAHRNLTAGQAQALAKRSFATIMLERAWKQFEVPPGLRVASYKGENFAALEDADLPAGSPRATVRSNGRLQLPDPAAVVMSTTPLRAETESGQLKPVDPTLVSKSGHFEPANARVTPELPRTLDRGIRLPQLDVSVEPAGAGSASDGEIVGGDKLFWANLDKDTDFFASPTPLGVEAFWQLRSADSPQTLSLNLELPPGASVEPAFNDLGAQLVDDSGVFAYVRPPMALDADGTPVPVKMALADGGLELSTDHRAGDWKYPILIDPPIEEAYGFTSGSACPGLGAFGVPRWRWEENPLQAPFTHACNSWDGIGSIAPGWQHYQLNWYAQWVWAPPQDAYIQSVGFQAADLHHHASEHVCTWAGLWSNEIWNWEPYAVNTCGTFYNAYFGWNGTRANNAAISQVYMPNTNNRYYDSWAALGGANFVVGDKVPPSFSSTKPSDSPWTDDTQPDGARQIYSYTASANDRGLGMKYFWLVTPRGYTNAQGQEEVDTTVAERQCSGLTACLNPSSWSHTFSYQLPEGRNKVSAVALDQGGLSNEANGQPRHEWYQPIDRSAPTPLNPPSGSLYDNRLNIRGDQAYNLTVSARDGNSSSDSTTRSGVKRIEVWVNEDEDEPHFVVERPAAQCNLAAGACPSTLQGTWQVDPYVLGEGQHTISVVATDQLGHASTVQQFTVNVTTDVAPGELTVTATPPAPDGSYQLVATAVETPATPDRPASGMSYMELIVDGVVIDVHEPGCPAGGCNIVRTYQMTGAQSLAEHHVAVVTYDRAGNGTTKDLGNTRDYYQRFGYGEDWTVGDLSRNLRTAYRGGANVIRQGFSWCDIAENPGDSKEKLPRHQWVWSGPKQFFEAVRAQNAAISGTSNDLRVVAILYNSPTWAREDKSQDCNQVEPGQNPLVSPPDPDYVRGDDTEWKYFVREFTRRFGPNPRLDQPEQGDFRDARLEAIEIWNEPNLAKFWGGGSPLYTADAPQRFADLVNAGSAEVESVAPSIDTLPGGMSPVRKAFVRQHDFLERATQRVGRPIEPSRIDGISIHLYADESPSDKLARKNVKRRYAAVVRSVGPLSDKSRWITEIGFPSSPQSAGQNERNQRQRLGQAYLAFAREERLKAFIVHRLIDRGDDGKQFGVLEENGTSCKQIYLDLARLRKSEARAQCPAN